MTYLDGAVSYSDQVIHEYSEKNWWMNLTFNDFLRESSVKYPNKLAVICENYRITYKQLVKWVDQFAVSLLEIDFKKNDRIVVQLPNSYEFLLAFLGAQAIGAVPVLALPKHNILEILNIFEITEPVGWIVPQKHGKQNFSELIESVRGKIPVKHLITTGENIGLAGAVSMQSCIDQVSEEMVRNVNLAKYSPNPNDVAHIMLTGGTSGQSKAVPRTYNSFLANVRYCNQLSSENDVNLVATPIGHTMAIQGSFGASLLYSGTMVLIDSFRPKDILEAIEKEKVTRLSLVPTQLIGILDFEDLDKYSLHSLKYVRVSGAALSPEIAARANTFFNRIGCFFLSGAYGSSEGPSTGLPIEKGLPDSIRLHSIGKPWVPGEHWKVIDAMENALPPGKTGEIAVKGPTVFTGYYRSPLLNEEIFTKDGYYKTGDLGYIDESGFIFLTGRKKDIIQRGGEGIVPSEIENLLLRHPSVANAAVVGMPDRRLGEKACAYVVVQKDTTFSFEEMVNFLKGLGTGPLLWPERLEIADSLPVTNVGKIDKHALRRDIEEKLAREDVAS